MHLWSPLPTALASGHGGLCREEKPDLRQLSATDSRPVSGLGVCLLGSARLVIRTQR